MCIDRNIRSSPKQCQTLVAYIIQSTTAQQTGHVSTDLHNRLGRCAELNIACQACYNNKTGAQHGLLQHPNLPQAGWLRFSVISLWHALCNATTVLAEHLPVILVNECGSSAATPGDMTQAKRVVTQTPNLVRVADNPLVETHGLFSGCSISVEDFALQQPGELSDAVSLQHKRCFK